MSDHFLIGWLVAGLESDMKNYKILHQAYISLYNFLKARKANCALGNMQKHFSHTQTDYNKLSHTQ